jgi:NAD(P)-dependent dehydrogenase (short-subunit alcohol dehydrogenase family)
MTTDSEPDPLSGKVAIVTGGTRGIGLAIARALVTSGARVVITGRNGAQLAHAARMIQAESAASDAVEAVRADVRQYEDVERVIMGASSRFGGLDVVVNNAGVGVFANVLEMTPDQWREVIDTNLTGVYYMCHAALPHLRKRGGGFIINISSLAGKNAFVGGAAYCASKSGLNAFSEALMQEVRYDNIRVSYVMPGSVATSFTGDESRGSDWKIAPDDIAEIVLGLLRHNPRSLPSRVEVRPSQPRK